MLYPKSVVDMAVGTAKAGYGLGYSVGMSLFYRRVGVPVILIGSMILEKIDQESDQNLI